MAFRVSTAPILLNIGVASFHRLVRFVKIFH